ncbi:MAG TPA: hypothetical protein VGG31_09000 [Candidatus Dormibacteraeota bacterium]
MALRSCIDNDPQAAIPLLLQVGERTDEPDELLTAVGSALASLSHDGFEVTMFDMRDLGDVAFAAFNDWMPSP